MPSAAESFDPAISDYSLEHCPALDVLRRSGVLYVAVADSGRLAARMGSARERPRMGVSSGSNIRLGGELCASVW